MSSIRDQRRLDRPAGIAIAVNGTITTVDHGTTVTQMLNQLGIVAPRVAVEINLAVIDREAFERTTLREGDRVEIVSFVGGGHG
ncbi:MAG: sulfur carrier protein ThiS [Nitrospirota bacterium]